MSRGDLLRFVDNPRVLRLAQLSRPSSSRPLSSARFPQPREAAERDRRRRRREIRPPRRHAASPRSSVSSRRLSGAHSSGSPAVTATRSARPSQPWRCDHVRWRATTAKAVVRQPRPRTLGSGRKQQRCEFARPSRRSNKRSGRMCRSTTTGRRTLPAAGALLPLAKRSSPAASSRRCWMSSKREEIFGTAEAAPQPAIAVAAPAVASGTSAFGGSDRVD